MTEGRNGWNTTRVRLARDPSSDPPQCKKPSSAGKYIYIRTINSDCSALYTLTIKGPRCWEPSSWPMSSGIYGFRCPAAIRHHQVMAWISIWWLDRLKTTSLIGFGSIGCLQPDEGGVLFIYPGVSAELRSNYIIIILASRMYRTLKIDSSHQVKESFLGETKRKGAERAIPVPSHQVERLKLKFDQVFFPIRFFFFSLHFRIKVPLYCLILSCLAEQWMVESTTGRLMIILFVWAATSSISWDGRKIE